MPMRNRRIRLLLLAIVIAIIFVLYSKSDPTTIAEAKQYAQRTYQQAYDQTLGKTKSSSGQLVNAPAAEPKKDEPFRVDFGAYSRAAAGDAEETSAPANIPPPAAAPPPPPKVQPPPAPVETKTDDPMRVDFAAYSKAAAADSEETSAPANVLKGIIANPNPIAGVHQDAPLAPAPKTTAPVAGESPKPKAKADAGKFDGSVLPIGEGRVEIDVDALAGQQVVHWSKQVEKYPPSSTIAYPFNVGSDIPKIQHSFKHVPGTGADAEKLAIIKAAAVHSWNGYREKAMGHDEVKPISGKYANPFNAWGATLVDSLDTLWMMGMIPEFEEALEWVKKIDFTTSKRSDIPLFETTIRYMGGLLGAYEVSGRNYKLLLDQASQLGEILYGAFDTPNRMPMTYYQWKPAFASQGHRASVRTIMSEIGSLSLEFTRLGQLVGNAKYYDAIARITDALEEWQDKTRIPGLWPTTLDASGCKKLPSTDVDEEYSPTKGKPVAAKKADPELPKIPTDDPRVVQKPPTSGSAIGGKEPGLGRISNFGNPLEEGSLDSKTVKDTLFQDAGISKLVRRALDAVGLSKDEPLIASPDALLVKDTTSLTEKDALSNSALSGINKDETRATSQAPLAEEDDCIPQGLASTSEYGSDIFTFGAAADSTYEYLPKMHMLMGGRLDQYQKMYKKAADASKKWLIYRPMIPDEKRELLFAGNVDTKPVYNDKTEIERDFKPVGTHLTCFVGGMFAMAGKIFNRPEDVIMGSKLTDGCVWAYNVTTTGIMPEILGLHKCESTESCKWDETAYYKSLDPFEELRLNPKSKSKLSDTKASAKEDALGPPLGVSAGKSGLSKRQYGGGEMQYGVQTGPDGLPPAAAAVIAEVPPLHQGPPGSGNIPPVSNSPYDAGASPKIPGDTSAVPAAGAKDSTALYPAGPDAAARVPGNYADSKVAPVSDNKVSQLAADAKDKIGAALSDANDKISPALTNVKDKVGSAFSDAKEKTGPVLTDAKDKVASTASNLKDKAAPVLADAKDRLTSDASYDKIPPAVPGKVAPTVPDSGAQGAGLANDNAKDKIAPAMPGSGLAPTVPDNGKVVDSNAPSKSISGASLHKNPEADEDKPPLPHAEFVKDKIARERLPPGMTAMYDKKYLLRPEAIESVFYMYRITGEQYWRDRGWEMWQAVSKHTHAKYGAASLEDVSATTPETKDSEESFWLAETLKYFYLLFDDPDRYSLDDWVLNTEAHFLSRLGA